MFVVIRNVLLVSFFSLEIQSLRITYDHFLSAGRASHKTFQPEIHTSAFSYSFRKDWATRRKGFPGGHIWHRHDHSPGYIPFLLTYTSYSLIPNYQMKLTTSCYRPGLILPVQIDISFHTPLLYFTSPFVDLTMVAQFTRESNPPQKKNSQQ